MHDREQCLARALEIMRSREDFWYDHNDIKRSSSYCSCADLLEYAIAGDWDALNQFDDYRRV